MRQNEQYYWSSPNPLETQQNQGFSSLGTPGCQSLRGRVSGICARFVPNGILALWRELSRQMSPSDLLYAGNFPRELLLEVASVCQTLLDFSLQRLPSEADQVEIRLRRTITMY
jgi:hypothetical protein